MIPRQQRAVPLTARHPARGPPKNGAIDHPNGNSFDLPVLRYRAMVHGVSAPGLSARPYFYRYSEDAVDLCDVWW